MEKAKKVPWNHDTLGTEPETAPFDQVEDIVLDSLFTLHSWAAAWSTWSSQKEPFYQFHEGENARARKKFQTYLNAAKRASLVDDETRQMRAREVAVGASSSRLETGEWRTTDGVDIVVGTDVCGPTKLESTKWHYTPLHYHRFKEFYPLVMERFYWATYWYIKISVRKLLKWSKSIEYLISRK